MFAQIPEFKGTTALDLMEHVKQVILDEPQRILMDNWGDRLTGDEYDQTRISRLMDDYGREFPACGTVGCVSGWMDYSMDRLQARYSGGLDYLPRAVREDARALFNGMDITDDDDNVIESTPYPFPTVFGVPPAEYAAAVAANITKFIERNREALVAHVIR